MIMRLACAMLCVTVMASLGCDSSPSIVHQRGDCVVTRDGFLWFVADVERSTYVVRGRFGDEWGLPTSIKHDLLDTYDLAPCYDHVLVEK